MHLHAAMSFRARLRLSLIQASVMLQTHCPLSISACTSPHVCGVLSFKGFIVKEKVLVLSFSAMQSTANESC